MFLLPKKNFFGCYFCSLVLNRNVLVVVFSLSKCYFRSLFLFLIGNLLAHKHGHVCMHVVVIQRVKDCRCDNESMHTDKSACFKLSLENYIRFFFLSHFPHKFINRNKPEWNIVSCQRKVKALLRKRMKRNADPNRSYA